MSLPLTLPATNISPVDTVQVVVSPNYYTAQVSFYNGATLVYTLTVFQQSPSASLPADLVLGDLTLNSGTVTMKIPSNLQAGSVTVNAKGIENTNKQAININATVGTWNLNQ